MTRYSSTLAAALALAAAFLTAFIPDRAGGAVQAPAPGTAQTCVTAADLTAAGRWDGEVDSQRVCLRLSLESGQFARLTVETAVAPGVNLEATVIAPDDSVPFERIGGSVVAIRALAWEAARAGVYTVLLTSPRRAGVAVTVAVEEPTSLAARRRALATDPRVAWLAARAIPIRALDPMDTDFTDLQPLRRLLANTRVVLLGEADHGDGSDFLAKSRLIRFLHAEMGFDVLAFEAGVYDMWRAWREISAGREAMASFTQGAFWMWAQARQLEPLVGYVAQVAHSPRPLVLAGFDVNRSGRTASADTLVAELTGFLQANRLDGPLADAQSAEIQLLRRLHNYQYRPQPDSAALAALRDAASAAEDRIERSVHTEEGRYWARILWNVAARVAWVWPQWSARRPYCSTEACRSSGDRDPEMVQNLAWLANQMYPGRKIIVWAHNGHVMRNPSLIESDGLPRYAMGDGVWSEFGDRSFAIAFVSYEGSHHWAHAIRPTYTIVSDQSPEPEFEELMAATGLRFGLLDLRGAAGRDGWLAQAFLARPLVHASERSRWAGNYDAFFFIRTQEPAVAIPF